MATIVSVADAIVTVLVSASAAGAFGTPITPTRHYQPVFSAEQLTQLKVSVVPAADAIVPLDRQKDVHEYRIDIGVQKKLNPATKDADAPALTALLEDLAAYLLRRTLPGESGIITGAAIEPIYDPNAFHLEHIFVGVLRLTVRVEVVNRMAAPPARPVSATYSQTDGAVAVTFDRPLVDNGLVPPSFLVQMLNGPLRAWEAGAAIVTGGVLYVYVYPTAEAASGIPQISYIHFPASLIDRNGHLVAEFTQAIV